MTEAAFRKLALSLAGAAESSHMGHADFRANGKIFATLPFEGDDDAKGNVPGGVGVLKLTPDQRDALVEAHPSVFEPIPGGWGRRGFTRVLLRKAPAAVTKQAMKLAWGNVLPVAAGKSSTPAKRQRP